MTEQTKRSKPSDTTNTMLYAPTLLRVREVARILALSQRQVYRLAHAGRLRAFRFGRSIRIDLMSVQEFIRDAAKAGCERDA